MNEQQRAPIWEALIAHRDKHTASFHVPGHKSGAGLDPVAADWLGGVYSIDLTEIAGLDDLHHPEGVIAEAQRLAAACYGAERTFLLVGGSTVGNLALILAVCRPGDVLLVQRNVHKSVLNGLALAGAQAVFIEPQVDAVSGLPCGIRVEDAEEALDRYPDAVGLLLTDPNYYGIGTDLRPLVEAAHRRGVPVLVDAAHGAHFGFHPELPGSAIAAGADGVVHSTHKMLTAMTMGAMLHVQGSLLDVQAVARALAVVQSSSPSYPILASLDLARRQLAVGGQERLGQAVRTAEGIRETLKRRMPWLRLAEPSSNIGEVAWTHDPLKLAIHDATGTLGGFELLSELEQEGCIAEMADPQYVLLTLGIPTGGKEADVLIAALERISSRYELEKQELTPRIKNIDIIAQPTISVPVPFQFHLSSLRNNGNRNQDHAVQLHRVKVDAAIGFPVDQQIVPYPPGVPLLYPGETMTEQAAKRLLEWIEAGSRIHGLNEDATLTIRVNGGSP